MSASCEASASGDACEASPLVIDASEARFSAYPTTLDEDEYALQAGLGSMG